MRCAQKPLPPVGRSVGGCSRGNNVIVSKIYGMHDRFSLLLVQTLGRRAGYVKCGHAKRSDAFLFVLRQKQWQCECVFGGAHMRLAEIVRNGA